MELKEENLTWRKLPDEVFPDGRTKQVIRTWKRTRKKVKQEIDALLRARKRSTWVRGDEAGAIMDPKLAPSGVDASKGKDPAAAEASEQKEPSLSSEVGASGQAAPSS